MIAVGISNRERRRALRAKRRAYRRKRKEDRLIRRDQRLEDRQERFEDRDARIRARRRRRKEKRASRGQGRAENARQGRRASPQSPAPRPFPLTRRQRASEEDFEPEETDQAEETEEDEAAPVRRRIIRRRGPRPVEEIEEIIEDEGEEADDDGGEGDGEEVGLLNLQRTANHVPGRRQAAELNLQPGSNQVVPGLLRVGKLKVIAPAGERGLVLPLAENVYLVSHWPKADIAIHGTQQLGQQMLRTAAARLQQANVGGEVGVLPLAMLLLRNRQRQQQPQVQPVYVPVPTPMAPVPTPMAPVAVAGATCGCTRCQQLAALGYAGGCGCQA